MTGKSNTRTFVVVALIVVVVLGVLASSGIVWNQSTTISFSVASSTVDINIWQEWIVYDKSGVKISDPNLTSEKRTLNFGVLDQLYSAIFDKAKIGYVRINEHHFLRDSVPSLDGGAFVLTTQTSGDLLVDGQIYGSITLSRWPVPSQWQSLSDALTGYNPNQDAAFFSGDISGTSRDGAFYIIFYPQSRPSVCGQYPASCIDLSSLVASGNTDVSVSANFQETWIEWSESYNPAKVLLGPCDFKVPLVGNLICIHAEEQLGPTGIVMKPIALRTLMSMTATTPMTNTVFFTTTVINGQTVTSWGVQYSNTTVVTILTTTPPNNPLGNSCQTIFGKDSWVCSGIFVGFWNWLSSSFIGIPVWIWLLGGLLLIILWYRRTPRVKLA